MKIIKAYTKYKTLRKVIYKVYCKISPKEYQNNSKIKLARKSKNIEKYYKLKSINL